MRQVPFAKADITPEDIAAVGEVLASGWLTHGRYTKLFEENFASFTGAAHAVTVSNCTAGLYLACLMHKVGPGDEVIVPAMTHTATAHAVETTGASAVFADVDPLTGNIVPAEIEKRIGPGTRGLIVVHMAGHPCDMDEICRICRQHNLFLIEDCAHALGTKFGERHVGNFGSAGVFSFYPTKQITTGEGGMVICNDGEAARYFGSRKAFGINTPPEMRARPGYYDVEALGLNFRMTDFQAALGYFQLDRYIAGNFERRKRLAKSYAEKLACLADAIEFPPFLPQHSYFLFQILARDQHSRDEIAGMLKSAGVGYSIHYATPVPLMSYYRNKYRFFEADFRGAANYGHRNLSLPVHPYIEEADQDYIVDVLTRAVRAGNRA